MSEIQHFGGVPLITFESNEEYAFDAWCFDAKDKGFIVDYKYQPETFELSKPVTFKRREVKFGERKISDKEESIEVLGGCSYTPDFVIYSDNLIYPFVQSKSLRQNDVRCMYVYYIDVKGKFRRFGTDHTLFPKTCWLFQKEGVFINKAIVPSVFKNLWRPDTKWCNAIYKQDGNPRKNYEAFRSFKEYGEENMVKRRILCQE